MWGSAKRAESGGGRRLVVLAESDDALRSLLVEVLELGGYRVLATADQRDPLEVLSTPHDEGRDIEEGCESAVPAIIVQDVNRLGAAGLRALRESGEFLPTTPILVITGFPSHDVLSAAASFGRGAVLVKPFALGEFLALVDQLIRS